MMVELGKVPLYLESLGSIASRAHRIAKLNYFNDFLNKGEQRQKT